VAEPGPGPGRSSALRALAESGTAQLFGSNALQALAAFAANLVLVRAIAPEGFGEFALALASITLVLAVFSLRLNVLILRAREGEFDRDTQSLYFSALVGETGFAALLGLAWLAAVGLLGGWSLLLLLAMLVRHFGAGWKDFFERGMRYRGIARVEGGSHLLAHGLSVGLAFAGAGPTALYLRELCSSLLLVIGYASLGGLPRLRLRWLRLREWRALARQARGVWLDGMLESAFARLLILLAGAVGGNAGAGYFFQAHRLAWVPHQLLNPVVGRFTLNWLSRVEEPEAQRRGRNRVMLLALGPLLLAVLATLLFADAVVPWIFGQRWEPVVPILVRLVGFILFVSLLETLRMHFLASQQALRLFLTRLAQYLGLLLPLGYAVWVGDASESSLALSVSLAYAAAFSVGLWLGRRVAP
jgi:O-antigen/teichoic acid export membrane protein